MYLSQRDFYKQQQHLSNGYLSGGINLEDVANAFTDPNKRFRPIEIPIVYRMYERDAAILGFGLGAIALGLFYVGYQNSKR